jgi:transcriptional regulator with XRE-family HTH domain
MKPTQFFREQLGLTQEMMAMYLTVTKSRLSMHELDKRELPSAAIAKLAEIAVFLDQNKTNEAVESEFQTEQELKLKTLLESQIKELEYKKIKEERLLQLIQKKYRQNIALYAFAQHLQKNKTVLAEVLLQQAIKGVAQNGVVNQTIQSAKVEAIVSQLFYLQSLKKK